MSGYAKISSVEAIEMFRSKLIVFLAESRPVLDEVSGELTRTRHWLQDEQRRFWQHELRLRTRKLEEAKQELFSATISRFHESTALHLMTVQRSQRSVEEAYGKLSRLKRWDHELDDLTAPLMKHIDHLYGFLATDMGRAVAHLDQILNTLDQYRQSSPMPTPDPTVPESSTPEAQS